MVEFTVLHNSVSWRGIINLVIMPQVWDMFTFRVGLRNGTDSSSIFDCFYRFVILPNNVLNTRLYTKSNENENIVILGAEMSLLFNGGVNNTESL